MNELSDSRIDNRNRICYTDSDFGEVINIQSLNSSLQRV